MERKERGAETVLSRQEFCRLMTGKNMFSETALLGDVHPLVMKDIDKAYLAVKKLHRGIIGQTHMIDYEDCMVQFEEIEDAYLRQDNERLMTGVKSLLEILTIEGH